MNEDFSKQYACNIYKFHHHREPIYFFPFEITCKYRKENTCVFIWKLCNSILFIQMFAFCILHQRCFRTRLFPIKSESVWLEGSASIHAWQNYHCGVITPADSPSTRKYSLACCLQHFKIPLKYKAFIYLSHI